MGQGRKRIYLEPFRLINFNLDEKIIERVKEICNEKKISFSDYMRDLIDKDIKYFDNNYDKWL